MKYRKIVYCNIRNLLIIGCCNKLFCDKFGCSIKFLYFCTGGQSSAVLCVEGVLAAHRQAQAEGRHDFIDTCTMMHHYGHEIHTILGALENIKITTPVDYFMFRSIVKAREEGAIFGL